MRERSVRFRWLERKDSKMMPIVIISRNSNIKKINLFELFWK